MNTAFVHEFFALAATEPDVSVTFTGTGSLTAEGVATRHGALTLTGTGTLVVDGVVTPTTPEAPAPGGKVRRPRRRVVSTTVKFVGASRFAANGTVTRSGAVEFAGFGTSTTDGYATVKARFLPLWGQGDQTFGGYTTTMGAVEFASNPTSLQLSGVRGVQATATFAGDGTLELDGQRRLGQLARERELAVLLSTLNLIPGGR